MDGDGNYKRHRRSRAPSPHRSSRRLGSYQASKSRSRSPRERKWSRSRAPSHPPPGRSTNSYGNDRRGHGGNRTNPTPSSVLGVFGLSVYTKEHQMREIFSKFGPIEKLQMVYDTKTGRSRGFGFVYFMSTEDARAAKEQCSEMEVDGQRIRVDYSLTARPHTPTPGIYMGRPTSNSTGSNYRRREHSPKTRRDRDSLMQYGDNNHYYNGSRHKSSASPTRYRRRRSPSPQFRRGRRRSRSNSYSKTR